MKELVLIPIALICAVMVVGLQQVTHERIDANQERFEHQQMIAMLPDPNETISQESTLFRTFKGSQPTGLIVQATTDFGYNDKISFWLAVDLKQEIRGVSVIRHRETHGIADFIEGQWLDQFQGASSDNDWNTSSGDFDNVTGATITSNTMITGIETALRELKESSERDAQ